MRKVYRVRNHEMVKMGYKGPTTYICPKSYLGPKGEFYQFPESKNDIPLHHVNFILSDEEFPGAYEFDFGRMKSFEAEYRNFTVFLKDRRYDVVFGTTTEYRIKNAIEKGARFIGLKAFYKKETI